MQKSYENSISSELNLYTSILVSGCSQQIDERLVDQTVNTVELLKEKLIELAGKRGFNQEIVYELFKDLKDRLY